jgi:hypothetical protein
MRSGNRNIAAAVALAGAVVGFASGCEAPEGEARDPAFPEAIGYTPPSLATAAAQPAAGASPQAPDADGYADTDPSALTDFRGTLEPYGTWTDDPTYGTVWIPSESVVGDDFTPYVSDGHWAYDDDYVWVSDYEWGWAPFHYGRWAYADGPGWEWIPGRQYAGAWVSWRTGNPGWGYVGWAPMSPTWSWRDGTAVGLGFVPRAPYAFVGTGNLFHPSVGNQLVTGAQVGAVAAHTTPYVAGGGSPAMGSSTGRVIAHPTVGGPTPDSISVAASAVVHVTGTEARGLAQARAYAHPSTAMALGARAPSTYRAGYAARGNSPYLSHFGGRLGGGFSGSAASQRPMATPYYGERGAGYGGRGSEGPALSTSRGYAPPHSVSSPAGYGGHSGGAPAFHGGSAPSSGFHGGGGGGGHVGGGGGHGGGGHR